MTFEEISLFLGTLDISLTFVNWISLTSDEFLVNSELFKNMTSF